MFMIEKNKGFSLIEVLVSIVIFAIGLLGLSGLHTRSILSQNEARQRSQALSLAADMVERIKGNRAIAASSSLYRVDPAQGDSPRGTGFNGSAPMNCAGTSGVALDLCEWHNGLLGTSNAGISSSLTGARGCVYELSSSLPKTFVVSVVWGGQTPTVAPSVNCGSGAYGSNDAMRRAISLTVTMPSLDD